ncbi:MAG: hypothetical protein EXQ95_11100 [Alphaproteobacteria bacterium]|nr:hypothetical protein [Alphaproteobacteria bacterium]
MSDAINSELIAWSTLYKLVDHIGPDGRSAIADMMSQHIAALTGDMRSTLPADPARLMRLADDGFLPLGRVLTDRQVADIRAHLDREPVFAGHVLEHADTRPQAIEELATTAHLGAYAYRSVITAPHLLTLANDPRLLALAEAHLGCVPTLYSLHAWWSFGGRADKARLTQDFHRDPDDFRFCVMFIYLTDVLDDETGPHQFIRASHRVDGIRQLLDARARKGDPVDPEGASSFFVGQGYSADLEAATEHLFADATETLRGPAGTACFSNTYGLHRGLQPRSGRRLLAWARYGLGPNNASVRGAGYPVPRVTLRCSLGDDARTRYINRLLVDMG